jgi:hypothetical protein
MTRPHWGSIPLRSSMAALASPSSMRLGAGGVRTPMGCRDPLWEASV